MYPQLLPPALERGASSPRTCASAKVAARVSRVCCALDIGASKCSEVSQGRDRGCTVKEEGRGARAP